MAVVTLRRPISPPAILPAVPVAQSAEGRSVERAAEQVLRCPEAQSAEARSIMRAAEEVLHGGPRQEAEDVERSYRSVPLETAFTVRVKYRFDGELAPLPYPLDE